MSISLHVECGNEEGEEGRFTEVMSIKILMRSGRVRRISVSRFTAKSSKNSLQTLQPLLQKIVGSSMESFSFRKKKGLKSYLLSMLVEMHWF